MPTNALELALWMESDRMGYLLPALTEAKFENQRDVVLNERRQNYENRPYGMAGMAIVAALYPPDHPYHWLTIGASEDLRAARLDEVRAFFQTLLPSRATRRSRWPATSIREARCALAERLLRRDSRRRRVRRACRRRLLAARRRSGWCSRIASSCRVSIIAWHSPALFGRRRCRARSRR